jgi:hypothetical protein
MTGAARTARKGRAHTATATATDTSTSTGTDGGCGGASEECRREHGGLDRRTHGARRRQRGRGRRARAVKST